MEGNYVHMRWGPRVISALERLGGKSVVEHWERLLWVMGNLGEPWRALCTRVTVRVSIILNHVDIL